MSHIYPEDKVALDHFQKAIDDSHELKPILDLFTKYPELEAIRNRELAIDGEECYGPWLGGEYYWKALDKVLQQWSTKELTKEQAYAEKLEEQVTALKKENIQLKKQLERSHGQLMHIIQSVCNRARDLGPEFKEYVDEWHRNCVSRMEKQDS